MAAIAFTSLASAQAGAEEKGEKEPVAIIELGGTGRVDVPRRSKLRTVSGG